jgi:hypothetical protein
VPYTAPDCPHPDSLVVAAVLKIVCEHPGASSDQIAAFIPRLPAKRVKQALHVLANVSKKVWRHRKHSAWYPMGYTGPVAKGPRP